MAQTSQKSGFMHTFWLIALSLSLLLPMTVILRHKYNNMTPMDTHSHASHDSSIVLPHLPSPGKYLAEGAGIPSCHVIRANRAELRREAFQSSVSHTHTHIFQFMTHRPSVEYPFRWSHTLKLSLSWLIMNEKKWSHSFSRCFVRWVVKQSCGSQPLIFAIF